MFVPGDLGRVISSDMSVKRRILFGGYRLARSVGFFRLRTKADGCANVICFHRVNDRVADSLTTPPAVFDELMRIVRAEYQPIAMSRLVSKLSGGDSLPPNAIAITFDDGYKDNRTIAAPILDKYDLPATFFLTSGYIDTDRVFPWDQDSPVKHAMMTWNDVRELVGMGFEIGGHTINHVDLGRAPLEEAEREIVGCKEKIEQEITREIEAFAFPFGRADAIRDDVLDIVRHAGFRSCCSAYGGKVTAESDLLRLERVPMYPTVTEMLMEIDNFMTYRQGRMKLKLTTWAISTALAIGHYHRLSEELW